MLNCLTLKMKVRNNSPKDSITSQRTWIFCRQYF